MKKVALIYNPVAGSGRSGRAGQVEAAAGVLRRGGIELSVMATRRAGGATDQAMEAIAAGCDTVIACGGDGTVHECMQRMISERAAATLGVLPIGTGNALARDLRLPKDPLRAAQALLEGIPRRIAVGRMEPLGNAAEGRYFIVTAGIGADAHMLYHLNFELKRRNGMRAYYTAAMRILFQHGFPPFEIEFGPASAQRTVVVSQVLSVRISDFGGLVRRLAPGASLSRKDMRLLLFRTPRRMAFLAHVARRLVNWPWLPRHVELADASEAICRPLGARTQVPRLWKSEDRAARIYAEVDGEVLCPLPVKMFSIPDALTLLVPRSWRGGRAG